MLSGINGNSGLIKQVRPLLWKWFQDNFESISVKFKNSMGLYGHIVSNCVGSGLGEEYIKEVEAWIAGGGDMRKEGLKPVMTKLSQCLEKMKGLTKWSERDGQGLREWAASEKF